MFVKGVKLTNGHRCCIAKLIFNRFFNDIIDLDGIFNGANCFKYFNKKKYFYKLELQSKPPAVGETVKH